MTVVRVLVVDDAPELRRLVQAVIERHNCGWVVVGEAPDGRAGIDRARSEQPDLVLLDLSMPLMDGLEALPLIREVAPEAIIVILTGYPSHAARDTAIAAGADEYLEKDELVATLIPRLERIVASLRSHGEPPSG